MSQDLPVEGSIPTEELPKFWMSSRVYDALKWFTQIALPAVGTLYFALAQVNGLPAAEQVVGSIVAVDVFLGVLLGLTTRQYNRSEAAFDGSVTLVPNYEDQITDVGVSIHPVALETGQKELRLRVHHK